MATVSLRQWDYESSLTENFLLQTKLTTLGTPDTMKTILGYFVNIRQNTSYSVSTPSSFILSFDYRTNLTEQFKELHGFNNITNTNPNETLETKKSINKIVLFSEPIKNILQIQLRLKSPFIQGDFNVNDFGLLYRVVRDTSTSTHDDD